MLSKPSNLKNRPIIQFIAALFLLNVGINVRAAEWETVNTPENGSVGYLQLDRASIIRNGQTVRTWTRAVYYISSKIEGSLGLHSRVVMALTEFDCAERTESTRKILYMSDDKNPQTLAERGPYPTADIIPGTPREKIFSLVCSAP